MQLEIMRNKSMIDTILTSYMSEQLRLTSLDFVRYKYPQIDWGLRMIGIVGPRGVGKSTMVLQRILKEKGAKRHFISPPTAVILPTIHL